MSFSALCVVHAPDANKDEHRCEIHTEKYSLFTVAVKNQEEALDVCREYSDKIDSVMLCPGFTNRDIGEIAEVVGERIGVCVARCDGPGSRIAMEAMKREGYF
jgi:hypothetical protein